MLEPSRQRNATGSAAIPHPTLSRCIYLDLEVSPEDNSLLAAAAYRPDTDDSLSMSGHPNSGSLQRFDRLAENALFLLGHNIMSFDIPHLQALPQGPGKRHTVGRAQGQAGRDTTTQKGGKSSNNRTAKTAQ